MIFPYFPMKTSICWGFPLPRLIARGYLCEKMRGADDTQRAEQFQTRHERQSPCPLQSTPWKKNRLRLPHVRTCSLCFCCFVRTEVGKVLNLQGRLGRIQEALSHRELIWDVGTDLSSRNPLALGPLALGLQCHGHPLRSRPMAVALRRTVPFLAGNIGERGRCSDGLKTKRPAYG